MKNVRVKLAIATASLMTLPAVAHDGSEQASVISGMVHFMTEPDHLLVSAAVAATLIYLVRKRGTKSEKN